MEREKLLPAASQILRVLDLKLPNADCCLDLLCQSHVGHLYKKGCNWRSHHRTVNFAHITEVDIGLAKCVSVLSRRLWQGALRDDTKNVCVGDQRKMARGDYLVLWYC